MELHAIRLGKVVFVTNPFELFLDLGNKSRPEALRNRLSLSNFAAGRVGTYPVPAPSSSADYGGLIINGHVGSDGGKLLVDTTVKTIADLWS
jgi:hypothetical protein